MLFFLLLETIDIDGADVADADLQSGYSPEPKAALWGQEWLHRSLGSLCRPGTKVDLSHWPVYLNIMYCGIGSAASSSCFIERLG